MALIVYGTPLRKVALASEMLWLVLLLPGAVISKLTLASVAGL